VDCSGLVQAVYRTHGVELPRDSDQQAAVGAELEPREDFSTLRAGDLLFFAEQRNRISHVAISAGGSRILHSALGNGGVRFNDLLGDSPYERELLTLLVRTTRVLSPES
jgi:cell wall-associated NlpC family hydrolase